ncbi:hypothetical protein [Hydrogenimonas urashimensis]|uniref:hypothetical protein n=1 Tax=Hydrogenimonas urashimensis TaxID=2740515 RepID=UPI0019155545|nr:hypothetical protein [Hydrogenimonas urashimensis]
MAILLLSFGGCVFKTFESPRSALIVIKSPTLKYADQGFVYRGKKRIKVQVYASGRAVFELTIGRRVCVNRGCMSEEEFYRKYLHVSYPKGTLAAIFSKRPIFDGEGLSEENGRSVQRIYEPDKFDIIYAFGSGYTRFKDRINHIIIKMTEIP